MSASIHNESQSPIGGLDNLLDESRSPRARKRSRTESLTPTPSDSSKLEDVDLAIRPTLRRRTSDNDSWSLVSAGSHSLPSQEIAAPLTEENLAVWEDTFNSPDNTETARNNTPSRDTLTSVMPKNLDERDKLQDYNVRIHVDDPKPAGLQRHLDNVVLKPRDGHPSPKGKDITKARGLAARRGEDMAVNILEDTLMGDFHGQHKGGITYITYDLKPRLSRDFLPPAPRPAVERKHKSLSQPEPDLCYGYITRKLAERAGTVPAFTQEEEDKLDLSPLFLLENQWFPCITAQWKSAIGGESIFEAQSQGGPDGAVIVNNLYRLYKDAYKQEPTVEETCAYSIVTDGNHLQFFVHWREADDQNQVIHHMEAFEDFALWKQGDMERARSIIKNIGAHAIGPRLQSIKAAINNLKVSGANKRPASETSASQ